MEIQEETFLKMCIVQRNFENIIRKEGLGNVEYIFKNCNEIRKYLWVNVLSEKKYGKKNEIRFDRFNIFVLNDLMA